MSEKFTCVFEFEISKFKPNPFHIETPYGKPETISKGDVCEMLDEANARIAALEDLLLEVLGDYSHRGFNDRHFMADRIRAALQTGGSK